MNGSETPVRILPYLLPVALTFVWWAAGRTSEKRHLKSLAQRERRFEDFSVTTLKRPGGAMSRAVTPQLVYGEAAIASDGFKSWVFGLRNLFGGESKSFASLFSRARREATLRMLAQARALGYDAVCNVRYETADIGGNTSGGNRKNSLMMAVCCVSGTAYRRA